MSGRGVDSERARVALLAAICDGSVGIAGRLLDAIEATRPQPGAPVTVSNPVLLTLSSFIHALESTPDQPLARFDVRLDMVRRVRFDKPSVA
jgi:hypothetical protein